MEIPVYQFNGSVFLVSFEDNTNTILLYSDDITFDEALQEAHKDFPDKIFKFKKLEKGTFGLSKGEDNKIKIIFLKEKENVQ